MLIIELSRRKKRNNEKEKEMRGRGWLTVGGWWP